MSGFTIVVLDDAKQTVFFERFASWEQMASRDEAAGYPQWFDRLMVAVDEYDLASKDTKVAVHGVVELPPLAAFDRFSEHDEMGPNGNGAA